MRNDKYEVGLFDVIDQKRVQIIHRVQNTEKKDERTMLKVECFYCLKNEAQVFELASQMQQ